MEALNFINKRPWLWKVIVGICVVLAVLPMVLCVYGNPLTCDESYYLSVMERMMEGKRLYKDVNTSYPPLWFFLMAGWKWLFHISSGCAEPYFVLHFTTQILAAFFLYKIICSLEIDRKIAFFCSWLFIMTGHWLQGNLLILEMSSIMFGLLSLWLVINQQTERIWRFFLGGLASACAFLCKQYGLGFFILAMALMIFKFKVKGGRMGVFVLGFALPILACLIAYGDNLVTSTLLNGYGTTIDKSYGRTFALNKERIFHGFKLLCNRTAPVLFVTLLFIPKCVREKKGWMLVFGWLGILGFMMVYYFDFCLHYMLYVLPFVMIIMAITFSVLRETRMWLRVLFVMGMVFTVGYSMYADYHNKVWKLYLHPQYKQSEIDLSKEVKARIPEGATLWIPNGGVYFVHFLANTTVPNLSTISYSFSDGGLTREEAVEQAEAADFILSFDWDQAEPYYTKELKDFIYSHEPIYVDTIWDIVLHDMSRMKK